MLRTLRKAILIMFKVTMCFIFIYVFGSFFALFIESFSSWQLKNAQDFTQVSTPDALLGLLAAAILLLLIIKLYIWATRPSLESIAKGVRTDSVAIMVPNSAEGYLFCYDSFNMPQEWIEIKNSFKERTPGGNVEVYKTGKPAISNHLQAKLKGYDIESVMIVPIRRRRKIIATLELVRSKEHRAFTNSDLREAEYCAKKIKIKLVK